MSQLVKTKRQANFKGFKRFGDFIKHLCYKKLKRQHKLLVLQKENILIADETYVEFTNFLHGYILNKANLDGRGQCREECDAYSYIRDTETNVKCNTDNDWCNNQHQINCPKIVNCQFMDSEMRVCKSVCVFFKILYLVITQLLSENVKY
jgi:hypothetical protein